MSRNCEIYLRLRQWKRRCMSRKLLVVLLVVPYYLNGHTYLSEDSLNTWVATTLAVEEFVSLGLRKYDVT